MEKFMGVDVGGTNIKIGIVDTLGAMHYKIKYSTQELRDSDDFVKGFVDIIEKELAAYNDVLKVGIGVPGTLSKDRSTTLEIPSTPQLNGVNIKQQLKERLPGRIFHLENDASAAALGEYYFSGEKMPEDYIFLTLGTGIGSAAIIDHEIFIGGDGNGMELGHVLSKNGKTLEKNIGKVGIMKRTEKLLSKKSSKLSKEKDLDPKKILAYAEKGDKTAIRIFDEVGEYLGEALVGAIRLLDIKTVLIGGGLGASFEVILKPMKQVLEEHLTPYYVKDLDIRTAVLGNNAGIVGAAALCFK